jgi:putative aldouronate transport system substrate-binding protein
MKKAISFVVIGFMVCGVLFFGSCKKQQIESEQYYQLVVPFFSAAKLNDLSIVTEELNKIARAEAGVEFTLVPLDWSAWDQQINLMISGDEKLDLLPVLGENYATTIGQGKVLPMDDYLKSDSGRQITADIGDTFMSASYSGGKIYGVPSIRDMSRSYGLCMRKDLLDKYNIDISAYATLDDLDAMFAIIKAGEPDMYMVYPAINFQGLVQTLFHFHDPLGDDLGVLMNLGQDNLEVVNLYATREYSDYVHRIRQWYLRGYIPRDAITTQDQGATMVKNGQNFSFSSNFKPGYASDSLSTLGYEMVTLNVVPPYTTTATVTALMWTLPITSKNPAKAIDGLKLMYTNTDFINLIDWGIENKHYVKVPGYNNIIAYPNGVTYDNTGWDLNAGWIFGDQLKAFLWEGSPPDLNEQFKVFNGGGAVSKALGFQYDSSSVRTAIAAVNNVVEQYRLGLEYGVVDPDTELPRFIQALKNAGIDEIIAEKQRQLDAWAAN